VKFELGLFENPYVPVPGTPEPADVVSLAQEAAAKSIVLMKNDNQSLPLEKNIRTLAVIGTDAAEARLGGYSRPGKGKVSMLEGIKAKVGSKTKVVYQPGPGRVSPEWVAVPPSHLSHTEAGKREPGLKSAYFNNINMQGAPVVERVDASLDFRWTLYGPDPSVNFDFFSARWTGQLTAPVSGRYKIGFTGNEGYRLFLDGRLILDHWKNQAHATRLVEFDFIQGKTYDLRAEFFESSGISTIQLIWTVGVPDDWRSRIQDAVGAARQADAAIVVAGIEEGEGFDRAHLGLPGHQEELISAVASSGKPVTVVLVGGSAVTMTAWKDKVSAILNVWYPGDQGGSAVADVLFGDYNPSGRLPLSFPLFEGQLPFVYNHKPTGRNDDYGDLTGQPLFPFGFGLSYTTFQYDGLKFEKQTIAADASVRVQCKVKNTGTRFGEEVVQLYIRDELSSVAQPIKQLKGFQRLALKPGEEKEITFTLTPDLLKILNDQMQWVVEPGDFRIMIGASSRDIRLRGVLRVDGGGL
jgi:beta-glucosidase